MANQRGGGSRSLHLDLSKRNYGTGNGVATVSTSIKYINTLTTATLNPANPGDPKRRRETKPELCGRGGGTSTLTHVPGGNIHSTRCTNDKVYGTKVSVCDYKR